MIPLKSEEELDTMCESGSILARILGALCSEVKPGRHTLFFDEMAEELVLAAGALPAFKGYRGYPATINASINGEVVHGIPSEKQTLRFGDLLSIDIGLIRDGLYVDMATTVAVGDVPPKARRLLEAGERSLWEGIKRVKIGNRLSDVSHAIGASIEAAGFYPVREYVGHGIGRALHEDPQIPNFGPSGQGVRLQEGMTLAIEPMVKVDALPTRIKDDRWTVVTGSGGLSVHFEHTVALTAVGVEVLTQGGDGRRSGNE